MRILLIDDDEALVKTTARSLENAGHQTAASHTGAEGLEKSILWKPDLILLDLHLPDMLGTDVLAKLNETDRSASVIVITGEGSIHTAVQAIKMGAEDYLEKPVDPEKMEIVLKKLAEKRGLQKELGALKRDQREMYRKDYLFLTDPEMQILYNEIEAVAEQEKVTVMILGETGTGKEHVARLLHALSPRKSGPFVELHCGSLPESILESELFGYEPGAFTDAKRQKPGLFEEAQGGSVFLDEIGELTPAVQIKLLKVIEQKSIRRLGGNREIPLDVRIITATHRDLEKAVAEGTFRQDLFYRLNVVPLHIPALRQRPNDIVQLANFFLKESCQAFNKKLGLFSDDILVFFQSYDWPGNVRQLKHIVERLVITAKGNTITLRDLPKEIKPAKNALPAPSTGALSRDEAEKINIERALTQTQGNRTQTAKLLGVTRKTLLAKMKNYDLE